MQQDRTCPMETMLTSAKEWQYSGTHEEPPSITFHYKRRRISTTLWAWVPVWDLGIWLSIHTGFCVFYL